MTFKQFIFIPVYIALLAVALVMLAKPSPLVIPHLWPWIAFQAWAMYFMAGCTLKGGVKTFLGYVAGALASIAIFQLMGLLLGWGLADAPALAIAVFIVVIGVICGERIPWLDFIPAWFVGAGVFFGVMSINAWPKGMDTWTKYGITMAHLVVSCLVGLIFGVVTVFIRTKYEAWLKAKQPAESETEAPTDA